MGRGLDARGMRALERSARTSTVNKVYIYAYVHTVVIDIWIMDMRASPSFVHIGALATKSQSTVGGTGRLTIFSSLVCSI